MGDYNANRFGGAREFFWDDMEGNGQEFIGDEGHWDVLADDEATYLATRLSGNPPAQRTSVIDYIIASQFAGGFLGAGARRGLVGEEIAADVGKATIHADLVTDAGGGMAFRQQSSDHLPVTIEVSVVDDSD